MLPCALGHFGVRYQRGKLWRVGIEHRLTLGLVLGVDDLPTFFLGSLSQAGAFSRSRIHAIEDSIARWVRIEIPSGDASRHAARKLAGADCA